MMFERCQHGSDMRATTGEAGHGVYAYPASEANRMRSYYGSGGETVWRLAPQPDAVIVDLTEPGNAAEFLVFARAAARGSVFGGPAPRISLSNAHRFGSLIERFIGSRYPEADAWLVRHEGAGIPSGKQLIIRSLSAFQVEEVGRSGPDVAPDIAQDLAESPGPA